MVRHRFGFETDDHFIAERTVTMSERAILILPDVGLDEDALEKLKDEFQNTVTGSLRRLGSKAAEATVVVVVVVRF
jgi:hypothetical protein